MNKLSEIKTNNLKLDVHAPIQRLRCELECSSEDTFLDLYQKLENIYLIP